MSLLSSKTSLKSLKYSDFAQSQKLQSPTDLKAFSNTGASVGQHRSPDTKTGLGFQVERRKEDVVRLTKGTVNSPQAVKFQVNQALLNQSVAINDILRGNKPDLKQAAIGLARVAGVTASAIAQAAGSGTGLRVIQGFVPLNGGYVVDKGRFGAVGAAISSVNPFAKPNSQISKVNIALRGRTINDGFIQTGFEEAVGFDNEKQNTTIRLTGSGTVYQISLGRTGRATGQNLFSKERSNSSEGRYLQGRFDSRTYEKRQFGNLIEISDSSKESEFLTKAGVPSLTREAVPLISLFGVQNSQTPKFAPFNTISKVEKDVKSNVYIGPDKEAKKAIKDLTTPGRFILPNPDTGTVRISDESVVSRIASKSRLLSVVQRTATKNPSFSEIDNLDNLKGYVGEVSGLTSKVGKTGNFSYYQAQGEANTTQFSGVSQLPEINQPRTLNLSLNLDSYSPNQTVQLVADEINKDSYLGNSSTVILAPKQNSVGNFFIGPALDQQVKTKFSGVQSPSRLEAGTFNNGFASESSQTVEDVENKVKESRYTDATVNKDPKGGPGNFVGQTTRVGQVTRKGEPSGQNKSLESRFYASANTASTDRVNVISFLGSADINPLNADIIPFTIQNIPAIGNSQFLYFRAYLDSMSDSYSGEWNGTRYIGRAEELYNYTGFKRGLQFSFKIAAHSQAELKPLYEKLNRLAGTTAPTYNNGLFMQGVFSKITIGDYVQKLPGFFTSVDLTWQTAYPWEIGNVDSGARDGDTPRVPHILDVSVSFQPVHDFAPQYGQNFIVNTVAS